MTPALEAQERAARESRGQLALLLCRCGKNTDPAHIEECELCSNFRPRCLTVPVTDNEGGHWVRCSDKAACEASRKRQRVTQ